MKYGIFFLVISGGFLLYGYRLGLWYGLLFWPALAFGIVAAGYLGVGARIFGKQSDGTLSPIARTILLPYLLYAWTVWQLSRLLRREACWNEIAPGLFIGRRAYARELPTDVRSVIDLTAEFAEPLGVRKGRRYVCLPTLDAMVPQEERLLELVETFADLPKSVYVHCAEGHRRSGTLAAAILLRYEMANDLPDAIDLLRAARPGVRLNGPQRVLLDRLQDRLQDRLRDRLHRKD